MEAIRNEHGVQYTGKYHVYVVRGAKSPSASNRVARCFSYDLQRSTEDLYIGFN